MNTANRFAPTLARAALLLALLPATTGAGLDRPPLPVDLGAAIAEQGNRALLEIRDESRRALVHQQPVLPPYTAVAAAP